MRGRAGGAGSQPASAAPPTNRSPPPSPLPALCSMPLELLYSEASLQLADARLVRKLLLQIRRAYGHHLRSHFHAIVPEVAS